jgi:hypothetical protein
VITALAVAVAMQAESRFVDEVRGYTVPIPAGWSVLIVREQGVSVRLKPNDGSDAALSLRIRPPMKDLADGSVKPEEFGEKMKQEYLKKYPDYSMNRCEGGKHGDVPCLLIAGSYTKDGKKVVSMQFMVADPANLWVLTATVTADKYDAHKDAFEKIARGLALTNKP